MKKMVILTIGQVPRTDIESTYTVFCRGKGRGSGGLLDGLTKEEAEMLYGADGRSQEKLVSRLTNGQSVTMDKAGTAEEN